jgi:hypothetical protein
MDYDHNLALIIDSIDQLMEDPQFISELAGEDETFLDTVRDFFFRLEAQFSPTLNVIEDPVMWREAQDAETD